MSNKSLINSTIISKCFFYHFTFLALYFASSLLAALVLQRNYLFLRLPLHFCNFFFILGWLSNFHFLICIWCWD